MHLLIFFYLLELLKFERKKWLSFKIKMNINHWIIYESKYYSSIFVYVVLKFIVLFYILNRLYNNIYKMPQNIRFVAYCPCHVSCQIKCALNPSCRHILCTFMKLYNILAILFKKKSSHHYKVQASVMQFPVNYRKEIVNLKYKT